ncbi:MAG: response regulator transcription factor, partial [Chloroflexi bacterium]|nr:response regulator transcription factor [Chloroflexota bacterium]
ARMRVALRHAELAAEPVGRIFQQEKVEIDLTRRLVRREGHEVHLTPTEYGLLRYLVQNAGRVVTHGQLLRSVLGDGYEDAIGS